MNFLSITLQIFPLREYNLFNFFLYFLSIKIRSTCRIKILDNQIIEHLIYIHIFWI